MNKRATEQRLDSGTARRRSITSTEAQNGFGKVLRDAATEDVVITSNGRAAAVLVSVARYDELLGTSEDLLGELENEFDRLLAGMQTPESAAAVDALFDMSPAQLGDAAVREASRDDE